jgi:hypothetical protein
MNWKRFHKRLRRLYHNLIIFVILVAVFGGLGLAGYLFIKYPKETKQRIAGLLGKTPEKQKPTPRPQPLAPPEQITEGFWRTAEGTAVPGLIHGRLDLAQFVRKGLLTLSGNISSEQDVQRLFDGKSDTSVRFDDKGNAQLVLEFRRPQLLTAVRLVTASTNNGTFTLDCMEEPASWTRPDLDQRTHLVLAADRPYESHRDQVIKFPRPVNTAALRLTLNKSATDQPAYLADFELYGRITITSIRLAVESRRLLRYDQTPVTVRVHDDNGLVLEGLKRIAWHSSKPGVAKVDEQTSTIKAIRPGDTQIVAEVYNKPSDPLDILVYAPRPGPSGVSALPFHHSVFLEWEPPKTPEWVSHYLIFRRTPKSEFTRKPVGRSLEPRFTDEDCGAGATYLYKVEAYNRAGDVIGESESSPPVTTSKDTKLFTEVPCLDVLVLLYSEGFDKEEMQLKRNGLKEAQLFYYRNSLGALLLNMIMWDINTVPPKTDDRDLAKSSDVPDEQPGGEARPTMAYIAQDISSRGVTDNEFDVIYATGRGLAGFWGGFGLLGAGGAFGDPGPHDSGVPITKKHLYEASYGLTWIFCHECHHAIDGPVIGDDPYDMYFCHFYDNFPLRLPIKLDCGAHYDGIAQILRVYPHKYYYALREPHNDRIETLDADQDGFPDYDPRFPMDEERFGSSPDNPDTDGDGLGDLAEFSAGNFFGADPNNTDTDGDGVPDGQDTYPLYNHAEIIPYLPGGHEIDGVLEPSWSLYTEGIIFSVPDGIKARVYANYDNDYLYLAIESNKTLKWFIELDASGEDGRWSSPYRFRYADPSEGGKSVGDVWAEDASFVIRHGKSEVTSKGFKIEGAKVAFGTRNNKSRHGLGHIVEIALPKKLPPGCACCYFKKSAPITEGLFLEEGKIFGLNFYFNTNDAGGHYDGEWGCLFEVYHLVDSTLTGPEDLDGDGLDARQESRLGTDPTDPDTDHDGVPDSRDPAPIGSPAL